MVTTTTAGTKNNKNIPKTFGSIANSVVEQIITLKYLGQVQNVGVN